MSEIKLTDEQSKIVDCFVNENKNICIEAYAGCSKSFILKQLCKRIPEDKSAVLLAFNKHIKEEISPQLPQHVQCFTSHGIGLNALLRKYGKDIQFDEFKVDKVIQNKSKHWDLNTVFDGNQDKIDNYLSEMKKLVNLCRTTLTFKKEGIVYLIDRHGLKLNDKSDIKNALKVMEVLMNDRKTYDYTDMIFLPAIDSNIFLIPKDYVLIDECLPYDQYIVTENGKDKIGKLYNMYQNGINLPLVETYNEEKKIFEDKRIEKIWCNGVRDIYQVVLNGKRKLRSTVNHRYLTLDGWKRLDELKIGDTVLSNNYNKQYIVTKEHEYSSTEDVYDMTVEDNHNFIVTSKSKKYKFGIIAHNCQDQNAAQQKMIEKMLKRDKTTKKQIGKLVSVGDPNQLIYSFLGVTTKSFEWFKNYNNTITLPLSYTFRCGKKIVEHAQTIVPNIKALPTADDGVVREGNVLTEAEDGDFVLCRTTMPLVKLFFHFLSKEKRATIKGSDIGSSLMDMIGRFNNINLLTEYWNNELINFQRSVINSGVLNVKEHSGYVALEDKVLTLVFLCRLSKDINDLKLKIQALFTEETRGIVLSTVHKSKGLEADRVFIVRPDNLPMKVGKAWEYQQEQNLHYVAITRAKKELIYDYNWKD